MHFVCKLDKEIYKVITPNIRTDDVIITQNQIEHIIERHPEAYNKVVFYLAKAITEPDYIISDKHPYTGLVIKKLQIGSEYIQIVLRLCSELDDPSYKNSIISCWEISEKRLQNYLRNKTILYKNN